MNPKPSFTFYGSISCLIIGILLTACSTEKTVAQTPVSPTTLPGYTVRDTGFSRKDFNVWVITTNLSFDSLFTATISPATRPDFDTDFVMAVKAETAANSYKVTYKDMKIQGDVLKVYFKVAKEHAGDDGAGWVSVSTFPKNRKLRRVHFYHDNVMIRSIPIVAVY